MVVVDLLGEDVVEGLLDLRVILRVIPPQQLVAPSPRPDADRTDLQQYAQIGDVSATTPVDGVGERHFDKYTPPALLILFKPAWSSGNEAPDLNHYLRTFNAPRLT